MLSTLNVFPAQITGKLKLSGYFDINNQRSCVPQTKCALEETFLWKTLPNKRALYPVCKGPSKWKITNSISDMKFVKQFPQPTQKHFTIKFEFLNFCAKGLGSYQWQYVMWINPVLPQLINSDKGGWELKQYLENILVLFGIDLFQLLNTRTNSECSILWSALEVKFEKDKFTLRPSALLSIKFTLFWLDKH